jgi:hypothetical protein
MPADTLQHICQTIREVKAVIGIPIKRERVQCDQGKVAELSDEFEAVLDGILAIELKRCKSWSRRTLLVIGPAFRLTGRGNDLRSRAMETQRNA